MSVVHADNRRNQHAGSGMVGVQNDSRVDERPALVVIGGGFAGVMATQKMAKHFRVTLVDCKEYFEYYPGICRAYVHPREHGKLARHYLTICDACCADFLWGEVKSVDLKKKTVGIECIATKSTTTYISYDYVLITSGCKYGIDLVHDKRANHGHECLWYPTFLKDAIDVSMCDGIDERFLMGRRAHIQQEHEALCQLNKDKATILVVGAGFVGIEYATEVKHRFPDIEVVIVEARADCIGAMPKKCIAYAQKHMNKAGIKCFYGKRYTKFLEKDRGRTHGASGNSSVSFQDLQPEHLEGDFDNLAESAKEFGIAEPARIYMAVGLRSINNFLPKQCLSETKGGCGGWIKVNLHQQVLGADGRPLDGVFAAGNCCDKPGGELILPRNVAPAETMSAVACHNIRVIQGQKSSHSVGGCCFGMCRPRRMQKMRYKSAIGMCATSLGPHDATFVAGSKKPGSGCMFMWGYPAALAKEFIRWSKVDGVTGGCIGTSIWKCMG